MKNDFLDEGSQKELLQLARRVLEDHLQGKEIKTIQSTSSALQEPVGAFVTLHKKGELRGCIGHLVAEGPLYETVKEMAVAAATQDYRFPPVSFEELQEIDIEISVLSPFREVKDVHEIEVGRHGLMMTRGGHRGLLLPQVATEYGWDRETFLAHTCFKAGLPPDAWKDPQTKIEIFSAQVFGEKAR